MADIPLTVGARGIPMDQAARAEHRRGAVLIACYLAVLILPPAFLVIKGPVPASDFLKQIALGLGLSGLVIVATSFILAARYRWLTRPFGLDAVMLFHRRMAIAGFLAIVLHMAILSYLNIHLLTKLWIPWPLELGRAAALLLTVQITISIFRVRLGVDFEKWRKSHWLLAVGILLLAACHGFFISHGFTPWPLRIVMVGLLLAALWSWASNRWVPLGRLRRHRYRVHEVREINQAVWQIHLQPAPGAPALRYQPGQFAFFYFHRQGNRRVGEEHVWTIASSPTEGAGLMLAIKELGDFTRTMRDTLVADDVSVHGAFGRFSHMLYAEPDSLVFIAAGIGITPFRSMLRWMLDRRENRRVLLLFANRTEADIPFFHELADYENRSGGTLRVVHVLSRPGERWQGERGHISISTILQYCQGDLSRPSFWICGPRAFATSVIHDLRSAGVAPARIHNEAFCLLHAPVPRDGRGINLKAICIAMWIAIAAAVIIGALARTEFLTAHPRRPQPRSTVKLHGATQRSSHDQRRVRVRRHLAAG
jgi:predicted ferric reductase